MYINNGIVEFDISDMNFVSKFGFETAIDMVLNFKSQNNLPFVYDTQQLAQLLGVRRKCLFDLLRNCNSHYRYTTIRKSNGKIRKLHEPSQLLKYMQKRILFTIISKQKISKYACAYHKGARLVDNAQPHCNKRFLLKLDVRNFFDNISFMQVYSAAFNTHYFPEQIGVILTTLCCREDVLPQGAPTSPALSNLVMKNFDNNFGKWCEKHGFSYTRYCDDITVSGDKPLYVAYVRAKSMLENMGFEINEKKTRFVTNSNCQIVTGLTVNEKARVPSKYRRDLRQELYYAFKFGLADSMKRSKNFEIRKNESEIDVKSRYYNSLLGKVRYVLQIEPDNQYFKEALSKLYRINAQVNNFY